MFYHEQRTQLGRWSPITTPHRPEQRKDGRLGKAGGVGPMIRRVKRVAAEHEGLSLAALAAIYGTDGTGDAPQGGQEPQVGVSTGGDAGEGELAVSGQHRGSDDQDDAETAPVFRSGRAQ